MVVTANPVRAVLDRYRGRVRGPRAGSPGAQTLRRHLADMLDAWGGYRLGPCAVLIAHRFQRRPTEGDMVCYRVLAMHREIAVYVSPHGQTVRVYVDHQEVPSVCALTVTRDDPDPVLFRTKKGTPLRASDIQRLADEAERGYCVAPATTGSVGRQVCGLPLPCPLHQ